MWGSILIGNTTEREGEKFYSSTQNTLYIDITASLFAYSRVPNKRGGAGVVGKNIKCDHSNIVINVACIRN